MGETKKRRGDGRREGGREGGRTLRQKDRSTSSRLLPQYWARADNEASVKRPVIKRERKQ